MALPPVLSESALARLRTKYCERLLVGGSCSFGDMCQYSHETSWLRRNPLKFSYSPKTCPLLKNGSCQRGTSCQFAHSKDEERYHPHNYKCTPCRGGEECGGYYCPFAHGDDELNKASRSAQAAKISSRGAGGADKTSAKGDVVSEHGCLRVDDYLQLHVSVSSLPEHFQRRESTFGFDSRIFSGLLQQNGASGGDTQKCLVKAVPAGRKESIEAAKVAKDLKRWMSSSRDGNEWRALSIRRSVATIYLAVPLRHATLDQCIEPQESGLLSSISHDYRLASQAASWMKQLVTDLSLLHGEGLSHSCITPRNIVVQPRGSLQLGDFLDKFHVLNLLAKGWAVADGATDGSEGICGAAPNWAWAMWYPAEVHDAIGSVHSTQKDSSKQSTQIADVDHFAVDVWQLGVTLFYMLTGEHMFGDSHKPKTVCQNIEIGEPVNSSLLSQLPLFEHLCRLMVARQPSQRPSIQMLALHPLFWSLKDAAHFAASNQNAKCHTLEILPCCAPFHSKFPSSSSSTSLPHLIAEFENQLQLQNRPASFSSNHDGSQPTWQTNTCISLTTPVLSTQCSVRSEQRSPCIWSQFSTAPPSAPPQASELAYVSSVQRVWSPSSIASMCTPKAFKPDTLGIEGTCSRSSTASTACTPGSITPRAIDFDDESHAACEALQPAKVIHPHCEQSRDLIYDLCRDQPVHVDLATGTCISTGRLSFDLLGVAAAGSGVPQGAPDSLFWQFPFGLVERQPMYNSI